MEKKEKILIAIKSSYLNCCKHRHISKNLTHSIYKARSFLPALLSLLCCQYNVKYRPKYRKNSPWTNGLKTAKSYETGTVTGEKSLQWETQIFSSTGMLSIEQESERLFEEYLLKLKALKTLNTDTGPVEVCCTGSFINYMQNYRQGCTTKVSQKRSKLVLNILSSQCTFNEFHSWKQSNMSSTSLV